MTLEEIIADVRKQLAKDPRKGMRTDQAVDAICKAAFLQWNSLDDVGVIDELIRIGARVALDLYPPGGRLRDDGCISVTAKELEMPLVIEAKV